MHLLNDKKQEKHKQTQNAFEGHSHVENEDKKKTKIRVTTITSNVLYSFPNSLHSADIDSRLIIS